MRHIFYILLFLFYFPSIIFAQNISIESFSYSKKLLENEVYLADNERKTLYCEAQFHEDKSIDLPLGFTLQKYKSRADRIEWEHVVPAENFGRTFIEWREGNNICVDKKGRTFKGRKCAEKANKEYRLMAADMHNLYPTIGAVNASRSNYNFTMLNHTQSDFGICNMKIDNRKVEPPANSRGKIARAYLYMEYTYPRYKMSKQQRQLMQAWNRQYPRAYASKFFFTHFP